MAMSPSAEIFGSQKVNSVTVSIVSPSICYELMDMDATIFVFECWVLRQPFLLSSITFIMRLFSSSSLSAIRVVSSTYLRLLIFLPVILIQLGFPGGSHGKELPTVWETHVQSLSWEDFPGEVNCNPLKYSCLENPVDRGSW